MSWTELEDTEFVDIDDKLYELICDYVYVDFDNGKKEYPEINEDFFKARNSLIAWIEKARKVNYEKIDKE